ncbi:MAG: delta-60 repeat domain-containing protein, partial [Verrucomicrobiota bacterium]
MKTHQSAQRLRFPKAKKFTVYLFSIALLLVGGGAAVRGQSVLDSFNPNANGIVSVIVVQPDGKILIGGYFTALTNAANVAVTRNHIARLYADGSLDTAFNPNAGGTVYAIAVQSDGKVLVGGQFGTIGGQSRPQIGRLDATTGAADSWTPNPNLGVEAIAVQSDGKILMGGAFSTVGNNTHVRIARLDAITGVAE